MDQVTIDLPKFADWIRAKNNPAVVGAAGICDGCPVAVWLRESGWRRATVTHADITLESDGTKYRMETPRWVQEFIAAVDMLEAPAHGVSAGLVKPYIERLEGIYA